jgi:hypothetical protein
MPNPPAPASTPTVSAVVPQIDYSSLPGYVAPENAVTQPGMYSVPRFSGDLFETPEDFVAAQPDPLSWGDWFSNRVQGTVLAQSLAPDALGDEVDKRLDTGYDFTKDPEVMNDPAMLRYNKEFMLVRNTDYAARMKLQIRKENEYYDKMSRESWTQFALGMPIEVLGDPTTFAALLIPGLGEVAGASKAARLAVGFSKGRTMVKYAAIGAAESAATEAILQKKQVTRGATDAAFNIALGSLLGTAVGNLVAASASKQELTTLVRETTDFLQSGALQQDTTAAASKLINALGANPAGAQVALERLSKGDLMVEGWTPKATQWVAGRILRQPALAMGLSQSKTAREAGAMLTNSGANLAMHSDGRVFDTNVEGAMHIWRGRGVQVFNNIESLFYAAKKAGVADGKDLVSFSQDVTFRSRRRGTSTGIVRPGSYEEFVEQGSKHQLDFEDWSLEQAKASGLFPEDFVGPKNARQHIMRIYSQRALAEQRNDFEYLVKDWLRKGINPKEADENGLPSFTSKEDYDAYIEDIAAQVYRAASRTNWDNPGLPMSHVMVPKARGSAKQRTLTIPDTFSVDIDGRKVSLENFLENDARVIAQRYARQFGAEVELTRAFGSADMKEVAKKIDDEYQELMKAAQDAGDFKTLKRLRADQQRTTTYLRGIRDKHRGMYAADAHQGILGNVARPVSAMISPFTMGMISLAAITDAPRIAFQMGLRNFLSAPRQLAMVRRSYKQMIPFLRQLDDDELRMMGVAIERSSHVRLSKLTDLVEDQYNTGMVEKGATAFTRGFYNLTLMPRITDHFKTVAATATEFKLLDMADRVISGKGLKPHQTKWLAKLNLTEADLARVDQLRKDGIVTQQKGVWHFNRWDFSGSSTAQGKIAKLDAAEKAQIDELMTTMPDPPLEMTKKGTPTVKSQAAFDLNAKARDEKIKAIRNTTETSRRGALRREDDLSRRLQSAIATETDRIVITPGIGDMPLSSGHPVGKIFWALKSFLFASITKAGLPALQQRGVAFLLAEALTVQAFAMLEALSREAATNGIDTAEKLVDSPEGLAQLVGLGVERNTFAGALTEFMNYGNLATGQIPRAGDVGTAITGKNVLGESRTKQRTGSFVEELAGPIGGIMGNFQRATKALAELAVEGGPLKEGQRRALARSVPGYTLPFIRPFVDEFFVEDDPKTIIGDIRDALK